MNGVIVGVDPGGTGAIAHLAADGTLLTVHDMPVHDGTVSAVLAATICLQHGHVAAAFVEAVHSMPKQGVASSFKFGKAYGCILGVLGALSIPVHHVTPNVWKRDAGLRGKDASRQRATELWPTFADQFARVKDDGRAEAALIARHGWLQLQRGAA